MNCLFCHQDHDTAYICEARCEARLSAILRMPVNRGSRQLTIQECMERGKRVRGKKRPAAPVITGKNRCIISKLKQDTRQRSCLNSLFRNYFFGLVRRGTPTETSGPPPSFYSKKM